MSTRGRLSLESSAPCARLELSAGGRFSTLSAACIRPGRLRLGLRHAAAAQHASTAPSRLVPTAVRNGNRYFVILSFCNHDHCISGNGSPSADKGRPNERQINTVGARRTGEEPRLGSRPIATRTTIYFSKLTHCVRFGWEASTTIFGPEACRSCAKNARGPEAIAACLRCAL